MDDHASVDSVASWRWGYDFADDPPGGFVFGEMILRADGTLLRRYGDAGSWTAVSWWPGERDPDRAARILRSRGYDLRAR